MIENRHTGFSRFARLLHVCFPIGGYVEEHDPIPASARNVRTGQRWRSILLMILVGLSPAEHVGGQSAFATRNPTPATECVGDPSRRLVVLTQHNDNNRTGANLRETCLNARNVDASSFGLVYTWHVKGQVYAQPLYVGGVKLPDGSTRNMVYIAT